MIVQVAVATAKPKETVEFFQWLLDLPISREIVTPGGKITFLGNDETKFEIIENSKAEKINAKGVTVGFAVDDLDAKLAMLDGKQIPYGKIISPAPNVRFALFNDLNGLEIQLFEEKK